LSGRAARSLSFLLCGCWVLSQPAIVSAAALTGEVYDIRTGAVVPGATVVLGGEKATARQDGIFKLIAAPRGPASIVARAPGYAFTVVEYLPVAPMPDEIWRNLPLMPLDATSPYPGGFMGLFLENAPLYEPYEGCISARRLEDLPLGIRAEGIGEEGRAELAARVERLNERWGTAIVELTAGREGAVALDFDGKSYSFCLGGTAGPRATFRGGATEDNLELAEAFLRRVVLTADENGREMTREALEADAPLAEDLDAVVGIIYRERPDFDYAIFKRRPPARFSLLTDLYLAIGGYDKHGITDESGTPVAFPVEYQMGQITLAGGGGYRDFWAKAGFWFSGIWEAGAEDLYESVGGEAEKVLRRNFSSYYRGGYRFIPLPGLRVSPFGGYRRFSVRGKYRGKDDPRNPKPPLDIDYTTRYDGPEAGVSWDLVFGWYNLGVTGEYARVFAGDGFNLAETGFGVTNRVGVGTFAFARFYWGRSFNYTFGGLAMKIDVPF
jgi:hypothetical protein